MPPQQSSISANTRSPPCVKTEPEVCVGLWGRRRSKKVREGMHILWLERDTWDARSRDLLGCQRDCRESPRGLTLHARFRCKISSQNGKQHSEKPRQGQTRWRTKSDWSDTRKNTSEKYLRTRCWWMSEAKMFFQTLCKWRVCHQRALADSHQRHRDTIFHPFGGIDTEMEKKLGIYRNASGPRVASIAQKKNSDWTACCCRSRSGFSVSVSGDNRLSGSRASWRRLGRHHELVFRLAHLVTVLPIASQQQTEQLKKLLVKCLPDNRGNVVWGFV